jgi:hypothetical protein
MAAPAVRQVADYMKIFLSDLEANLPLEEPGRHQKLNLFSEFVSHSKRKIVLYISVGSPITSTTVYRICYTMPVSPAASRLFVNAPRVLPPEGPFFKKYNITGQSAETFVTDNIATIADMADWASEIRRIHAKYIAEPEGIRKSTFNNIILYWKFMRGHIYNMLYNANVHLFRTSSGNSRATTPSISSHVSNTASNVGVMRSSSSTRRSNRTSSSSKSHASRPNYHLASTSDPKSTKSSRKRRTPKSDPK